MKTVTVLALLIATVTIGGCRDDGGPKGHKSPPTARVEGGRSESDAALVILEAKTIERLGIEVAPVVQAMGRSERVFGANVLLPPAARQAFTAPTLGQAAVRSGLSWPEVGDRVAAGTELFTFHPQLSPERDVPTRSELLDAQTKMIDLDLRRSMADRDSAAAEARLKTTTQELERSLALLKAAVGSEKRVEDARLAKTIAETELNAARSQVEKLQLAIAEAPKESQKSWVFTAFEVSEIESIAVSPGQVVAAGTPLMTVVATAVVWLEVEIYSGDLKDLNLEAAVAVSRLDAPSERAQWQAEPLEVSVASRPQTNMVRKLYRLTSSGELPAVGERVTLSIPQLSEAAILTMPRSALVYDQTGQGWVYVEDQVGHYRRQAVLVMERDGDLLRLIAGPAAGTKVVTAGVAELFGTEFGTGN